MSDKSGGFNTFAGERIVPTSKPDLPEDTQIEGVVDVLIALLNNCIDADAQEVSYFHQKDKINGS